jgi:hypothetical protein
MFNDIKKKVIYDIEVFPNFFCFNAKKPNEDKWYRFKLDENSSLNSLLELKNFLAVKSVWIAFNQIHYDDVVLSFIIKEFKRHTNTSLFLKEVFNFSDILINLENNYEFIKPYKYNNEILNGLNIDLFLYWSKGLRISKKISLKSLGVGLKHHKLQELPYKAGTYLTPQQQKEVYDYCDNDVLVTEKLYNNLYDTSNTKTGSIKLRDDVYKQTGIKCYSFDTPKIASETLALAYSNKTELEIKEVKNFKFKSYENLKIGDLFNDIKISFQTKKLQQIWLNIQNSIDKVEQEFVFICNNTRLKIAVGNGGIHSLNNNEKYFTDDKYDLYTSDVASLYPTNIINAKTIRFEEVLEEYIQTKKERIIAKAKGDKAVDKFKKLILNSTSGLLDSKYSWLYYPEGAMKLRLLGQLQLLILIEKASLAGYQVVSTNTDGIELLIPKGKFEDYLKIVKKVEDEFNIVFEHEKYKAIYYSNVNNYIAILENGKTKKKGSTFLTEPELGDSNDFLVIPKALEAYFVKKIPVEEFIKSHINTSDDAIYDYCMCPKVDKSYRVIHNGKEQQRLNRFYPSADLNQGYIYKLRDGSSHHLLKDSGVTLFNDYVKGPYNINFDYFITKCKEIINDLEPKQLSLF